MDDYIDSSKEVREGEQLDSRAIETFLKATSPELSGDVAIEQFPSGHSNLTYCLKVRDSEFVLRRPPIGSKVAKAHDMGREWKILTAIHPVYPLAPKPVAFCEDESVIGAKFYLMERIKGVIFRRQKPKGLALTELDAKELTTNVVKNLARIHAIDYDTAGLSDIAKPEGFLERQVNGWTERYWGSQTDDIEGVEEVTDWLKKNIPQSPPATLIHNDYKYDNIVLDADDISKIVGVLDWEMSTIGDPLMDLGIMLGYWVQADDIPARKNIATGPTYEPGSLSRREMADIYSSITGLDTSNINYYVVFAIFKLAVISQQIYYRYAKGLTQDKRFAPLIYGVKLLVLNSRQMIEKDEI